MVFRPPETVLFSHLEVINSQSVLANLPKSRDDSSPADDGLSGGPPQVEIGSDPAYVTSFSESSSSICST